MFLLFCLLGPEAHAETGQVAITEGKQDHEHDEKGIMIKEDGQVNTRLNVTQHEEWDENDTTHNHPRK